MTTNYGYQEQYQQQYDQPQGQQQYDQPHGQQFAQASYQPQASHQYLPSGQGDAQYHSGQGDGQWQQQPTQSFQQQQGQQYYQQQGQYEYDDGQQGQYNEQYEPNQQSRGFESQYMGGQQQDGGLQEKPQYPGMVPPHDPEKVITYTYPPQYTTAPSVRSYRPPAPVQQRAVSVAVAQDRGVPPVQQKKKRGCCA
eukprot:GHVN01063252.1.p1 GENE.GHVN01063252.1~~GHVN01063252.1.p1  ORF type:complete len:195 (-),score=21.59 GHVN01063252.1:127-711(-)